MRFPKPPFGIVSWFGNSRSYDCMASSCRAGIVAVISVVTICRATPAGICSLKKNQA
jgi:hypothetical protein